MRSHPLALFFAFMRLYLTQPTCPEQLDHMINVCWQNAENIFRSGERVGLFAQSGEEVCAVCGENQIADGSLSRRFCSGEVEYVRRI